MTTRNEDLKSYTTCWLRTNVGDHYAGMIVSAEFDDANNLALVMAPMLRVEPNDAPNKWRFISRKEEYSFTLESCLPVIKIQDGRSIFESSLGDKVTLSYSKIDESIIQKLMTDNP